MNKKPQVGFSPEFPLEAARLAVDRGRTMEAAVEGRECWPVRHGQPDPPAEALPGRKGDTKKATRLRMSDSLHVSR